MTSSRERGGSGTDTAVRCIWNVADGATSISVSYPTENRNGLSNVYALNEVEEYAYFEPTDVNGYPAVYAGSADLRDQGDCGLNVGLRNDMAMGIGIQSRPGNNVCGAAKNVAEAVIQTIKQGA